ncbi:hypothetical protein KGF56_002745 [Candida oxycetoniae]|uniref:Uncharacterized protein n=1 Tax=Candida oxycetoniae TaxID=497107 RepID=A0AAI9SWM3_9ASCO|nr:uncharacterized protein KGF56_002745 [Candida oxycetoniae]KAI3404448.2 hypothetical protein KGF56_002745 [Candida oxycetoniae]
MNISDSEDEISVDYAMISNNKLKERLSKFSPTRRKEVEERVSKELGFNTQEDFWNKLVDGNGNGNGNANGSEGGNTTTTATSNIPDTEFIEEENKNHLNAYINCMSTRRNLRRRNFASTHPYLSDQAYYLGLSNIDYLNELYEENDHDIEAIVKLLNYNYITLKKKYPKDEKYKQKSFFSILGMQTKSSGNDKDESNTFSEETKDLHYEQPALDNDEFTPSSLSTSQVVDYSDVDMNKSEGESESDDDDDDDDDDDEEEEEDDDKEEGEVYVRVGGRYKKEKFALKGVLPESAKHLPIYKPLRRTKIAREKPEKRKGLAIKKKHRTRNFNPRDFDTDFVDDTVVEYEWPSVVGPVVSNDEASSAIEQPGSKASLQLSVSYSDSCSLSSAESDLFESDIESRPNTFPVEEDTLSEAEEEDKIDRMLVVEERRTQKENSIKSRRRPSNRKHHSAARSDSKYKRVTNREKKQSQIVTKTKRRPGNSNRRTYSTRDTYRQLELKTIRPRTKNVENKKKRQKIATHTNKPVYWKTLEHNAAWNRCPELFTTVFEAEGENVNTTHELKRRLIQPSFFGTTSQPIFDYGCMINDIKLTELRHSDSGKTFHSFRDPVYLKLTNCTLTLSLLNIAEAHKSIELALLHWAKSIKTGKEEVTENMEEVEEEEKEKRRRKHRNETLYDFLRGLVSWYLVSQQPPSPREWALFHIIVTAFLNDDIGTHEGFYYMPYLALLQYTMTIISKMNGESCDTYPILSQMGSWYWQQFFSSFSEDRFEKMNFAVGCTSQRAESFYIMCIILQLNNLWFSSMIDALEDTRYADVGSLLDAVFHACRITKKGHNWEPLQLVFQKIEKTSNSSLYCQYIEIIYRINRERGWPVNEKIILQIYRNVSLRKFANFEDEQNILPELFDHIRSTADIPACSFFDCFMQLLSSYISGLSDVTHLKRLVIKLFSSNEVQYTNSRQAHNRFINKFNLIILLCSITAVDLRNQIDNLMQSIADVDDFGFIKSAAKAMLIVLKITFSKSMKVPRSAMEFLIRKVNSMFYTKSGVKKLWKFLIKSIRAVVDKNKTVALIQLLPLVKQVNLDDMEPVCCADTMELCCQILQVLAREKLSVQSHAPYVDVVKSCSEYQLDILSASMRKLSARGTIRTNKRFIEHCINFWVTSSFIIDANWDKLILQTFRYIGNEETREKFEYFFYSQILKYYDMRDYEENIAKGVIRSLSSFTIPEYLTSLLSSLSKARWRLFSFREPGWFSHLDSGSRYNVLIKIIGNYSKYYSAEKAGVLLHEMLQTIKLQLTIHISSLWYKEFCIQIIKELPKYDVGRKMDSVTTNDVVSILGLKAEEVNQINLNRLTVEQKVTRAQMELASNVNFKDNSSNPFCGSMDLNVLYSLMLCYTSSDFIGSLEWRTVFLIIQVFVDNCLSMSWDYTNEMFMGFLKLVQKTLFMGRDIRQDEALIYYKKILLTTYVFICWCAEILFEGYETPTFFHELKAIMFDCAQSIVNLRGKFNFGIGYTVSQLIEATDQTETGSEVYDFDSEVNQLDIDQSSYCLDFDFRF